MTLVIVAVGLLFLIVGSAFRDRVFLDFSCFYGAFLFSYGMGFFLQLLDNVFDATELAQVKQKPVT